MNCNIDRTDRNNRIVIGLAIILIAVMNLGKFVLILLGIILIIEGIVGWCGIPIIIAKLKKILTIK